MVPVPPVASGAGDDPECDFDRVLHRLDVIEVAYTKEAR
jgi:hypothetical protein